MIRAIADSRTRTQLSSSNASSPPADRRDSICTEALAVMRAPARNPKAETSPESAEKSRRKTLQYDRTGQRSRTRPMVAYRLAAAPDDEGRERVCRGTSGSPGLVGILGSREMRAEARSAAVSTNARAHRGSSSLGDAPIPAANLRWDLARKPARSRIGRNTGQRPVV